MGHRAGAGTEWIINPGLGLKIMVDINNVFDDNLDAVHNFNGPNPEGYSNFVNGLYGRLLIGVSFNLNPFKKNRSKDTSGNKRIKNDYYPFYNKSDK
jgi:hypothetical protein